MIKGLMKKQLLFTSLVFFGFLSAAPSPGLNTNFNSPMGPKLHIHNKILAKVHGRSISMLDVIKKMNVFINDIQPEMMSNPTELYAFYNHNWKVVLDQIVNQELMLMEAEEKEIQISEGEIREEMFRRFGSNMRLALKKLNLNYEEAKEMIRKELIVQGIQWYKVQSKALQRVTPHLIKTAYQEYLKKHDNSKYWSYRFLTLRNVSEEQEKELNAELSSLIAKGLPLEEIKDALEFKNESLQISLSPLVEKKKTQEISQNHLSILETLKEGALSEPLMQSSRNSQQKVMRVFSLEQVKENTPKTFEEMYDQIKDQLLTQIANQESKVYNNKLRDKYGANKEGFIYLSVGEEYQPFELK